MSLALVHEHNTRVEADALLMAEKQLVVQLQRTLEDLKKDNKSLQKEAADLRSEIPVLNRTITELKAENVTLRDRLSVPVNAGLSAMQAECSGLKAELRAAQEKVSALEGECKECDAECEQMEADLTAEKVRCADLSARLESERVERNRSMETFKVIIAGLQKEDKTEDKEEEKPQSFEIDVIRGGDNLTRKLKVRMV
jgi:chromosome segregation ATPase